MSTTGLLSDSDGSWGGGLGGGQSGLKRTANIIEDLQHSTPSATLNSSTFSATSNGDKNTIT